jgi:hypothetical protein
MKNMCGDSAFVEHLPCACGGGGGGVLRRPKHQSSDMAGLV